jgi:glutamate dehydrogenase (NAD(P)+)
VADLITGYGVAESVRHYYSLYGGEVEGKRILIQGWGNVGAAAALYLANQGAVITGIIDRAGGILSPEGLNLEEVRTLFLAKEGNALKSDKMIPFEEVQSAIWSVGADVFLPCAASRLVTEVQLDAMLANGLEVISCGANVPFADKEIFYGPISEKADGACAVIPDFIANCGMARVFGYLMGDGDVRLEDEAIFMDTSGCIRDALERCQARNPSSTGVSSTALAIALEQLV